MAGGRSALMRWNSLAFVAALGKALHWLLEYGAVALLLFAALMVVLRLGR